VIARIARIYKDAFSELPTPVWLLSLVAFVNRCGTMVVPFLSLYMTREMGYSKIEAGTMLGVFGAGSIVGSYLGGWLGDRLGVIRVQGWSLALSGVGFLALPRLERYWAILAAMFVVSVVSETFRPAAMAATVEYAPAESRTRALALLRLAVNLGIGFGLAAGGWLASRDYDLIFLADAVTCWLAAAILFLRMRRLPAAEDPADVTQEIRGKPPWKDLPFMAFLFLVFALAMVFFQVWSTFPLYLREAYRFREDVIGLMFTLNAVMIVVLEMPLVRAMERRNTMRLVGLGSLLVCAGFGMIRFGSSVSFAALAVAVWTFGEMLALPFTNSIVAHRAGPGSRGRYMGAYGTSFSLANVLAPVAGTAIYQRLGTDVLWFTVAAIGPLLWLAFEVLGRTLWKKR
jgi:predicted MFS family arabinose efflux permease